MIRECTFRNQWPLYLWGETGVGKTCAAAVAFGLWRLSAAWMSLTELCDTLKSFQLSPVQVIRSGNSSIELTMIGFWERLRKMGLVVADEIGTRDATAHRYDALLRLLETRQGKPLILTGNINPDAGLASVYDERIQSRIAAGVMLHVTGPDRRMDGIENRIHDVE